MTELRFRVPQPVVAGALPAVLSIIETKQGTLSPDVALSLCFVDPHSTPHTGVVSCGLALTKLGLREMDSPQTPSLYAGGWDGNPGLGGPQLPW